MSIPPVALLFLVTIRTVASKPVHAQSLRYIKGFQYYALPHPACPGLGCIAKRSLPAHLVHQYHPNSSMPNMARLDRKLTRNATSCDHYAFWILVQFKEKIPAIHPCQVLANILADLLQRPFPCTSGSRPPIPFSKTSCLCGAPACQVQKVPPAQSIRSAFTPGHPIDIVRYQILAWKDMESDKARIALMQRRCTCMHARVSLQACTFT